MPGALKRLLPATEAGPLDRDAAARAAPGSGSSDTPSSDDTHCARALRSCGAAFGSASGRVMLGSTAREPTGADAADGRRCTVGTATGATAGTGMRSPLDGAELAADGVATLARCEDALGDAESDSGPSLRDAAEAAGRTGCAGGTGVERITRECERRDGVPMMRDESTAAGDKTSALGGLAPCRPTRLRTMHATTTKSATAAATDEPTMIPTGSPAASTSGGGSGEAADDGAGVTEGVADTTAPTRMTGASGSAVDVITPKFVVGWYCLLKA